MLPGAHTLVLREQNLSLLPQRAIFWHEEKTLIVADVHLGKAQTFQRAGIAVPAHSFQHDLARLTELVVMTEAERLLVLGDFVHHRSGLTAGVMGDIQNWCESLGTELIVVLGNHDKPNRELLARLPLTLCEPAWQRGPFIFVHDDLPGAEFFRFLGHVHPVVNLPHMRLPVFALYHDYCVLPAFSFFTGGAPVKREHAQIFVALDEAGIVMPLPGISR